MHLQLISGKFYTIDESLKISYHFESRDRPPSSSEFYEERKDGDYEAKLQLSAMFAISRDIKIN